MSRRRAGALVMVALLVTSVVAGFTGGALAQQAGNASGDTQYYVQQGNQCMPIQTFGNGSTEVSEFYDYRYPELNDDGSINQSSFPENDYSSYGTQDQQRSQYSRLFVYEGTQGTSLVVVNDQLNDGNATPSNVTFEMSQNSLQWAVKDDEYPGRFGTPDDNFSQTRVYWQWGNQRTDGGALRGLESEDSLTITPTLNESMQGIEFLSANNETMSLEESEFTIVRSAENPCADSGTQTTTPDQGSDNTTTPDQGSDNPTSAPDQNAGDDGGDSDSNSGSGAQAVSAVTTTGTSSSAQIVPPPNGGTVSVPLPTGSTNGVTFQDAAVDVTANSLSFQFQSNVSSDAPDGSAADIQSWAYLDMTAQGSEADVTTADVSFTVTEEALNASGVAAENVTVMYQDGNSWSEANVTVDGEGNDGRYAFVATVPAESTLAVGVPSDGASAGDGGNATTTDAGNETTANGTTTANTADNASTTSDSTQGAAQGETQTGTASGGESGETGSTSSTSPGFGFAVSVIAIAGSALLALRRRR